MVLNTFYIFALIAAIVIRPSTSRLRLEISKVNRVDRNHEEDLKHANDDEGFDLKLIIAFEDSENPKLSFKVKEINPTFNSEWPTFDNEEETLHQKVMHNPSLFVDELLVQSYDPHQDYSTSNQMQSLDPQPDNRQNPGLPKVDYSLNLTQECSRFIMIENYTFSHNYNAKYAQRVSSKPLFIGISPIINSANRE